MILTKYLMVKRLFMDKPLFGRSAPRGAVAGILPLLRSFAPPKKPDLPNEDKHNRTRRSPKVCGQRRFWARLVR